MKNQSGTALKVSVMALIILGLAGCNSSGGSDASNTSSSASDFPIKIGQVGPVAPDNVRQEPFACVTQDTDLGQPTVDNQDGIGYPVTDGGNNIIGYSADCGAAMKVSYYYRSTGDGATTALHPYDLANPPGDVAMISVGGRSVPFIVRFEQGTINRYIYSISMLSPTPEANSIEKPDLANWNGDLVFYFIGGVGIGHTQSHDGNALNAVKMPGDQTGALALLARGYAIVNSTGAATSTTYNLKLGGETAHMVKEQFVAAYGKPKHTFGLGGSGGAVQQFI